jgi:hypothetical protein
VDMASPLVLPDWEYMEQLAVAPAAGDLDGLQPTTWRPWLVRLGACLMCQRQLQASSPAAVDVAPLIDWLETHYGSTVGHERRLPAEGAAFFLGALQHGPCRAGQPVPI